MFTGRVEESRALERMLFHTKNGNPQHFLVHGERGIGKSSLLFVHEITAAGRVAPWDENVKYNFLTTSVVLEHSDTYESILRNLGAGLRRSLAKANETKQLAKEVWDFVKSWEVMGVKYAPVAKEVDPSELLDELVFSYSHTCTSTGFDGILVLIDEADKPSTAANLGALLKGFTERLTRQGCDRVAVGVAGLTVVMHILRESHESSVRVFTTFHLKPLLPDERVRVIELGLKEAAEKNGFETTVTQGATKLITEYSEGYPHFIQQFGYCAFEADTDSSIDEADVKNGAWGEHGASNSSEQSISKGFTLTRSVRMIIARYSERWRTTRTIG